MCPERLAATAQANLHGFRRSQRSSSRRAERPRSHGTAGCGAGEFCSALFLPRLFISAAMTHNMPPLKRMPHLEKRPSGVICVVHTAALDNTSSRLNSYGRINLIAMHVILPVFARWGRGGNCAERWIYEKLMTRCTINAGLFGKPHTKRHQFAEPTALRRTECTSRACGVNASLWVRPSTRGSTAPQGAQLVNLVVRCTAYGYALIAMEGNQGFSMRLFFALRAA